MHKELTYKAVIGEMTLEEKASLMSGDNFWNTKPLGRLGIPSIMLTDGPHGLRKQGGKADHLGLNKSIPATCFPTAATLANSWDEDLLREVGQCLGKEARTAEVSVLLGPGMNIKRNPLCGRNFEYFSEDPFLTGRLAAAMTRGIQMEQVSACPKHFAVNSQETHRMAVDEVVDERALHELYLEGFRHVVKEASPKTIMTAYNKVNGTYANENVTLLQDILIKGWGYEGMVVTDWGGNNDRVAGLIAGNTLEMPSTNGMTDAELVAAVREERIPEGLLDLHVDRLLDLIASTRGHGDAFDRGMKRGTGTRGVVEKERQAEEERLHIAHHAKAIEAACRSMVLLKNDQDLLPLTDADMKIAVIGDFAEVPRYQGAGSSLMEPTRLENLKDELEKTDLNLIGYEKGFRRYGQKDQRLKQKAVSLAEKADIVLLFLGLDEGSEAEGVDRKHMRLPDNQLALVEEISKACEHIVVVLAGGSPVEMPFNDKVQAILHGYLPGQGGGVALARTLIGENNPSGKLAESYPMRYADVASSAYYPGRQLISEHRESIFIGYRHYDRTKMAVRYPFGHGLSYTEFAYSDLAVDGAEVTLTVTNTGKRPGEEVVQIYVAPEERKVFHEEKGLKGFAKASLQPGESRSVTITLDDHAFAYYHIGKKRWVTEAGRYLVVAGASSRDLRLSVRVEVDASGPDGMTDDPYEGRDVSAYDAYRLSELTSKDFENLLGHRLPENDWKTDSGLGPQDLMEQAQYGGWFGRLLYRLIIFTHHLLRWMGRPIASNNVLFLMGMPFRSVARMSGGIVDMEMLEGILKMVNGRFITGLWHYVRACFRKGRQSE